MSNDEDSKASGNIFHAPIHGDVVNGDKFQGDKVKGDKVKGDNRYDRKGKHDKVINVKGDYVEKKTVYESAYNKGKEIAAFGIPNPTPSQIIIGLLNYFCLFHIGLALWYDGIAPVFYLLLGTKEETIREKLERWRRLIESKQRGPKGPSASDWFHFSQYYDVLGYRHPSGYFTAIDRFAYWWGSWVNYYGVYNDASLQICQDRIKQAETHHHNGSRVLSSIVSLFCCASFFVVLPVAVLGSKFNKFIG